MDHRCDVLFGAGDERGADRGPPRQLDAVDAAVAGEVDFAEAAREVDVGVQLGAEARVQGGRLRAHAAADARRFEMAGEAGPDRGRDVGVRALHRADDRHGRAGLANARRELGDEVAPYVRVVFVGVLADAGAVHGEDQARGDGCARGAVDADQVEPGVDRDELALPLLALVVDRLVVHVRVERPVARESEHLGGADGEARRLARRARGAHGRRDLVDEELRPRGVEAGAVRGEAVVEVGPEELARTGVRVCRADHQPRERHVAVVGDRVGHEVLQHGGSTEQIALHDRE